MPNFATPAVAFYKFQTSLTGHWKSSPDTEHSNPMMLHGLGLFCWSKLLEVHMLTWKIDLKKFNATFVGGKFYCPIFYCPISVTLVLSKLSLTFSPSEESIRERTSETFEENIRKHIGTLSGLEAKAALKLSSLETCIHAFW